MFNLVPCKSEFSFFTHPVEHLDCAIGANKHIFFTATISPTAQESVLQGYVNVIGVCVCLYVTDHCKNTVHLTFKSDLSAHLKVEYIFG